MTSAKEKVTGQVQDLAVLKRIKRAAESIEKGAATLNGSSNIEWKQQEIFIPQWPELAMYNRSIDFFLNNYITAIYPSRTLLALKMF